MASTAPFDIGTLIEVTPGVYGGRPCLAGTRFPVMQVAVAHNAGMSPEEMIEHWLDLDLASVYAAVAYYLANKEAVDCELEEDARLYAEGAAAQRADWAKVAAS